MEDGGKAEGEGSMGKNEWTCPQKARRKQKPPRSGTLIFTTCDQTSSGFHVHKETREEGGE